MDQELFDKVSQIISQLGEEAPMSDERRALFEEFISYFETYPAFWLQYIREELKANETERALKLFYRCLPNVPDVELFQEYLKWITTNCTDKQKIWAAYEYAVANVGKDMAAIPIYNQYVEFAEQAGPLIVPIEKLRKVFQQALLIPMDGLTEFHLKYRSWEKSKNENLANINLPEQERHFKATAAIYHEKKRYQRQLQCQLYPMQKGFDSLHRWRLFIEYEKKNRLGSNPETLKAYVVYAYKCALMSLRYCSILWHEYAQFLVQIDDSNEAIAIYAQAIKIIPNNLMLHFTYAELLESRKRAGEARQVYIDIIKRSEDNPSHYTLSTIQYLKFLQRTEGPISMRTQFIKAIETGRCIYHLFLAIAEIENYVNMNVDATLKILRMGLEKYGDDPAYIEATISMLIKMNADEDVITVIENTAQDLPVEKRIKLYKQLYSHLLYCRGKENLLQKTAEEILKYDKTETPDKMTLRQFFLPVNFKENVLSY